MKKILTLSAIITTMALTVPTAAEAATVTIDENNIITIQTDSEKSVDIFSTAWRYSIETESTMVYGCGDPDRTHDFSHIITDGIPSIIVMKPTGKFNYDTEVVINQQLYVVQETGSTMIRGDLNRDYKINIADLYLMSKYILGNGSNLSDINIARGDVNADQTTDIYDMIEIRKAVLNEG